MKNKQINMLHIMTIIIAPNKKKNVIYCAANRVGIRRLRRIQGLTEVFDVTNTVHVYE